MFSALSEKVERLEKENEELKSQLRDFSKQIASFESRPIEKTNQEDSKKFEEMLDKRLRHNVCVGTRHCSITHSNYGVFKNVNDFLTYDPEQPKYVLNNLLGVCSVFYVESLEFFPIFAKIGFDIFAAVGCNVHSYNFHGKHISTPFWISAQQTLVKGEGFDVFREACLKYNVHLLFNGEPV